MKSIKLMCLSFLIGSSAIFGMAPEQQLPLTQRSWYFKGFSRAATLGRLLIEGSMLLEAYTHFKSYTRESYSIPPAIPPADEPTTQFVREELKKNGIQNPENIDVHIIPDGLRDMIGWSTLRQLKKQHLLIPEMNACKLAAHQVVKQYNEKHNDHPIQDSTDPAAIDECKFLIGHEAQHLIHNDNLRRLLFLACAPFATHWSVKGLKLTAQAIRKSPTKLPPHNLLPCLWYESKKIMGSTVKLATSWAAYYASYYQEEQRCDDNVRNEKNVLTGGIKCFESIVQRQQEIVQSSEKRLESENQSWQAIPERWKNLNYYKHLKNKYLLYPLVKKHFYYIQPLLHHHPPHEYRLKRLQERLDALEKTEQEKSQEPK